MQTFNLISTVHIPRKMYKELVIQTPLVFTQLLQNQIWQSKQRNYASYEMFWLWYVKQRYHFCLQSIWITCSSYIFLHTFLSSSLCNLFNGSTFLRPAVTDLKTKKSKDFIIAHLIHNFLPFVKLQQD